MWRGFFGLQVKNGILVEPPSHTRLILGLTSGKTIAEADGCDCPTSRGPAPSSGVTPGPERTHGRPGPVLSGEQEEGGHEPKPAASSILGSDTAEARASSPRGTRK